jgi:hypothetical protein
MRNLSLAIALAILPWAIAPAASADGDASACADAYCVHMTVSDDPTQPSASIGESDAQDAVHLAPVFHPNADVGACGAALGLSPAACAPAPAPAPAAPAAAPALTAGRVLQAFQRIPLPHLRSVTQPDEKTLVNFDTIFYVDADQFQRTLTLLGRRVTLAITPSSFTWNHGDGTSSVTSTPGAPYPSKDVVYRYQKAHRTVAHSVTIVWTARYRVGNGPWQDVPGSVNTTGPATDLRIAEATPVLTGQR